MTLRPTGKPAQQLMSLLWAKDSRGGAYGKVFTFTRRLIDLGYVQRVFDGLEVMLTPAGEAEARRLAATPEGARYMREGEEEMNE